ncbi:hypothetical protein F66182_970 [Fusarium sp. NRRL 66182]|nr:hypothetical protein F66182_970 [Fusarium sp. NRRL 66182]
MHFSTLLYGIVLLQGAMASPVVQPAASVEARDVEERDVEERDLERRAPFLGDLPFPKLPALKPKASKNTNTKGCETGSNTQTNACSSGDPYCCVADGNGGQTCSISNSCNAKIICCNNNNGYQMCIGDVNFNMPITINLFKKK